MLQLLDAFERADRERPSDLTAFLRDLPKPGTLPSPWETWTLICLVRHRQRQCWVRDIVINRLQVDVAAFGTRDWVERMTESRHPVVVPGLDEWEYQFRYRGCDLRHRGTQETIEVIFWDATADHFDASCYTSFLDSLKKPDPPEQRLRELYHSLEPMDLALTSLIASGALTPREEQASRSFRLAFQVLAREDAIGMFCQNWTNPAHRIWLAGLIGDWIAADEAAEGEPGIQQITGPRADQCRRIHREYLVRVQDREPRKALFGLAELDGAEGEIAAALLGPNNNTMSAALDIIAQREDRAWCTDLYTLFLRMSTLNHFSDARIWVATLRFLLRHNYQKQSLLPYLANAPSTGIGECVLLALEHAPEHALPLIRRGLGSKVRHDRTDVAVVLAGIARPWVERELMRILESSRDQDETAEVRIALLKSGDPQAELAVVEWDRKHARKEKPGVWLEVDGRKVGPLCPSSERLLENRARMMQYGIEEYRNRVTAIQDVIPQEPRQSGWSFWKT